MGPHGISRPVTAKAAIVSALRDEIEGGTYDGDPDGRLPTRVEVCRRFGVSEQTAKAAYGQLVNEGLVIARPRDGYFVRRNDITLVRADTYERRYVHEERFASGGGDQWEEDVRAQGREPHQSVEVRIVSPPPAMVATRLKLGAEDAVLVRDRLRSVDGVPNMIAASYYNAAIAQGTMLALPGNLAEAGGIMAAAGLPYRWRKDEHRARLPTQEEARRLALPDATAVVEWISTRFSAEDEPVAVMISILPGDRSSVVYNRIETS